MKKRIQISIMLFALMLLGLGASAQEQDTLPYREIPEHPTDYNAANMASRMVDGLGFRFYWATEGLREVDLEYRPSAEARSVEETIDHILSMTYMLVNSVSQSSEERGEGLAFDEKRALILTNLKATSDVLRNSNGADMETFTISLNNGETLPFWNYINGPIADCIWHCGQIASFRRLSGNPFNPKVSLLVGKVID
ncbi:MAG: hypothetical protein WEC59_05550 [Salibacteraceae bacterium]